MAEYYIKLLGPCPSKKSMYDRVTVRGIKTLAIKKEARAMMDLLQIQLQSQWKRGPLIHPDIAIKFTASNDAIDKDGMQATILDLLQPKGSNTIKNDNIRYCNGTLSLLPAEICAIGCEQVEIWLSDRCI